MAELRRKHKAAPIKITYADGTSETAKQGDFDKRRANRSPKPSRVHARARRTKHWKKIRKQAKQRDGYQCTVCGSTEKLEVHHLTYERLFREELEDVKTLCQRCHAVEHSWRLRRRAQRAA